MRHYAAHEFLETQESIRSKAAHIELYGVMIHMSPDAHLTDILINQQRRMIQSYQQGVALLNGRGIQSGTLAHTPQMNVYEQPRVGLDQPQMTPPNPQATRLSDSTIATIALTLHKTGASTAMLWACECADPQIRSYHATNANICQEMAYEIWQYLNYRGYYQAPELSDKTMSTMAQAFQAQQPGQTYQAQSGQTYQTQQTGRQIPMQTQAAGQSYQTQQPTRSYQMQQSGETYPVVHRERSTQEQQPGYSYQNQSAGRSYQPQQTGQSSQSGQSFRSMLR